VGHLLYSRMWTKALYDLGYIGFDEPYKKLVNQGMIQGVSQIIYKYNPGGDSNSIMMYDTVPLTTIHIKDLVNPKDDKIVANMARMDYPEYYFSADAIPKGEEDKFIQLHVPILYVENSELNLEALTRDLSKFSNGCFRSTGGFFVRGNWYDDNKKIITNLSSRRNLLWRKCPNQSTML